MTKALDAALSASGGCGCPTCIRAAFRAALPAEPDLEWLSEASREILLKRPSNPAAMVRRIYGSLRARILGEDA